jgi:hypothetical protein
LFYTDQSKGEEAMAARRTEEEKRDATGAKRQQAILAAQAEEGEKMLSAVYLFRNTLYRGGGSAMNIHEVRIRRLTDGSGHFQVIVKGEHEGRRVVSFSRGKDPVAALTEGVEAAAAGTAKLYDDQYTPTPNGGRSARQMTLEEV